MDLNLFEIRMEVGATERKELEIEFSYEFLFKTLVFFILTRYIQIDNVGIICTYCGVICNLVVRNKETDT